MPREYDCPVILNSCWINMSKLVLIIRQEILLFCLLSGRTISIYRAIENCLWPGVSNVPLLVGVWCPIRRATLAGQYTFYACINGHDANRTINLRVSFAIQISCFIVMGTGGSEEQSLATPQMHNTCAPLQMRKLFWHHFSVVIDYLPFSISFFRLDRSQNRLSNHTLAIKSGGQYTTAQVA